MSPSATRGSPPPGGSLVSAELKLPGRSAAGAVAGGVVAVYGRHGTVWPAGGDPRREVSVSESPVSLRGVFEYRLLEAGQGDRAVGIVTAAAAVPHVGAGVWSVL